MIPFTSFVASNIKVRMRRYRSKEGHKELIIEGVDTTLEIEGLDNEEYYNEGS